MSNATIGSNFPYSASTTLRLAKWRRGLFGGWLICFYLFWLGLVGYTGLESAVRANAPIAIAMAGGSFVAGSSPVAGGTVGFPVLVYVFDHPARLGRDFSLAIQSIGMGSASIYIFSRGRNIEWRILRFALLGAAVAMPLGMAFVAPHVSDKGVKTLFSVVYASFGLLHLARLREIIANQGPSRTRFNADPAIALMVGVLGGLLASVIGVGADILLYGTLVLLYHTDVKIAIPTAVILMAFTSVIGTAYLAVASAWGPVPSSPLREVLPYWLAAAPVVAVGAPLGALVSRFFPRRAILVFVALLCLSQFAWTCFHEQIVGWSLVAATIGVMAFNLALHALFLFGRRAFHINN